MTTQSTTNQSPESTVSNKRLHSFEGLLIPGIHFSSGYCVWAFNFTTTPDGLDPFSDVWVIAPDGERTLIISSEEARETIARNHAFDRTLIGEIRIDQPTPDTAHVTAQADDLCVDMELTFTQTGGTRMLNMLGALTPDIVARSGFGSALSTLLLNRLVEANGTKVAGRFGTGEPYRFEATRIAVVTDATATVNDEDLGGPTRPDQPVADGDVRNMPLFMAGRAYVPVWN